MQVRGSDDTLQFADKFRNYSKEDGHQYRNLENKKFVLRRKSKVYCPNCKSETNLNDIYCKECGTCLESISKRTYDFSIKNILSNIGLLKDCTYFNISTSIFIFNITLLLKINIIIII